jgi:hypothetical protein
MELLRKIDDVAHTLGFTASTIKKYYLLFEQHGYRFQRSNQGHVMFNDDEVELFRELVKLKNEPGITLPKAVEMIITSMTDITVMTEEVITDMTDIKVITEHLMVLKELAISQQSQINSLIQEQKKSNQLIETKSIDRDQLLMQSIKETMEVKQLLIEQKNKKWWQKLF